MKVAIYFSAELKDIIFVNGVAAETGALAACISGTKEVPELHTEEQAVAAIDGILSDLRRHGAAFYLRVGGTLDNDLSDKPYKLLGVYDA